jgi:signal recognition particle receptor subunit beta
MVFFNHATRQMTAKIVYYGPGLCGKTTNLNTIYGKTSKQARGEMVSLNTETDRTLFFDLLPMDVGTVGGFKTKLQLYTVPGQVFYNSTRKLVLKGVDGIVFVVDSQTPMLDACKESFQNLQDNLKELGLDIRDIPVVYQWNKRDLRNVVSVEELEAHFNPQGQPSFQAIASDGSGVFETLRGITRLVLTHIKTHVLGEGPAKPAAPEPQTSSPSALTLSDLPSVSDVLELNTGLVNDALAKEEAEENEFTDTGLHIDAPDLPEPPAAVAAPSVPAPVPAQEAPLRPSLANAPAPLPEEEEAERALPAPAPRDLPAPVAVPVMPAPAAAPAAPVLEPLPETSSLAPVSQVLPPITTTNVTKSLAPKQKVLDKGAIDSLLGELTQVGRMGAPSMLRIELPGDIEGDVEVVVQVRQAGQVKAEQAITRPAPKKGITSKLSVELKKS